MFITLKTAEFKNQYAAYQITDLNGALLFVGVGRVADLLSLPGAPPQLPETVNVILSSARADYMAAANDALLTAQDANRPDLIDGLRKAVKVIEQPSRRAGRPIECVETGERFYSVNAAAIAHGCSYFCLHNHLKGMVGYKSVKGKTYKYL